MSLIETVEASSLNLLSVGRQHVILMDRALRDRISRHVSPEAARLFAQAKLDGAGGPIDWYLPPGVKPGARRALSSLDDMSRTKVLADVQRLLSDVKGHAAELARSPDPLQRRMGEALDKAAQFPGEDHVFLIGDQPVVTCWGATTAQMSGATGVLERRAPVTPKRTPVEAPAAGSVPLGQTVTISTGEIVYLRQPSPWASLLALLLLMLFLAAIARTLVPACGVHLFLLPAGWTDLWCGTRVAEASQLTEESERLERELAELRRSVAANACEVPARRASDSQIERRVVEEGGKVGEINIVLRWQSKDDLDLSIACPRGETISYQSKTACGGELDVDRNAQSAAAIDTPIENIVFPRGQAAKGTYRIAVTKYAPSTGGPVPFEVIVRIRGQERKIAGTVDRSDATKIVGTFEVD